MHEGVIAHATSLAIHPMKTVIVAVVGIRLMANGWICARRMGRVPRSCVFGCVEEDPPRHDVECEVLCGAALAADGRWRLSFGILADGEPEWRQDTMAVEVYNAAAHERTDDDFADLAMSAVGRPMLRDEAVRLARTVVDALPVRQGRCRRDRPARSRSTRRAKSKASSAREGLRSISLSWRAC